MALELSQELPSGVSGNYWRIAELVLGYLTDTAYCVVKLYKDSAARTAGKEPLSQVSYLWKDADFAGWFDATTLNTVNYNPQERAYAKLKTLDEFTGATDV